MRRMLAILILFLANTVHGLEPKAADAAALMPGAPLGLEQGSGGVRFEILNKFH